ncbi:MAG TPA: UvrB/UvrC motif-containing protein [Candidatus Brocadiia bacterium]|nr:UvrB/UvrC motif-containing protein [Candidatus Brocadiia bacterium]
MEQGQNCEKCGRPATCHVTEIAGGKMNTHHLCESCARKGTKIKPSPIEMLAKLLMQASPELKDLAGRKCPECGITFLEFQSAGRLGCPKDYELFEPGLEGILDRVHVSTAHVGKRPSADPAAAASRKRLQHMKQLLTEAVAAEDYESAAKLRDKIREMTGSEHEC